jgi:hypothetical protein
VDLVTRLNTDTGPQAHAGQFHVDVSGLARGLASFGGDMMDIAQREQAINERAWLSRVGIDARKEWTRRLAEAETNGQPMTPEAFEEAYQADLAQRLESAPTRRARLAAEEDLQGFGLSIYRQSVGAQAALRVQQRTASATQAMWDAVRLARDGAMPLDQARAVLQETVGDGSGLAGSAMVEREKALLEIDDIEVMQTARTAGYATAAEQVRAGKLASSMGAMARESLALRLESRARLEAAAQERQAAEQVQVLSAQAASGEVDPKDLLTAEAARAAAMERKAAIRQVPMENAIAALTAEVDLDRFAGQVPDSALAKARAQVAVNAFRVAAYGRSADEVQRTVDGLEGRVDPAMHRAMQAEAAQYVRAMTPGDRSFDPVRVYFSDPAAGAKWQELSTAYAQAQGAEAKAAAAAGLRQVLREVEAFQLDAGIPASEVRYLTQTQAETLRAQARTPEGARAMAMSLMDIYGDRAHLAARQVLAGRTGQMPGVVLTAMLNMQNREVWEAATWKPETKFEKTAVEKVNELVAKNLTMRHFLESTRGMDSRAELSGGLAQGVAQMAFYHASKYGTPGQPDEASVQWAMDRTLGSAYVFAESGGRLIRMDKGATGDRDPQEVLRTADNFLKASLDRFEFVSDRGGEMRDIVRKTGFWQIEDGVARLYAETDQGIEPVAAYGRDGNKVNVEIPADALKELHYRGKGNYIGGDQVAALDGKRPVIRVGDQLSFQQPDARSRGGQMGDALEADLRETVEIGDLSFRVGPEPSRRTVAVDAPTASPDSASTADSIPADRLGGVLREAAPVFESAGEEFGVDSALLAAISMHETANGTSRAAVEKGNLMGISDRTGVRNWKAEGRTAEESVRHMASRLAKADAYKRWRATGRLEDLAAVYAPVGAENDPRGLNKHWVDGVRRHYRALTGKELL